MGFVAVSCYSQETLKRNLIIQKTTPLINLNGTGATLQFYNGDVSLTQSSNLLTLSGGNFSLGANDLLMTGSLGATAARLTKGWFANLEITNLPTVNGGAFKTALSLTASDVGLGNVTNESKTTMFTNPVFTGSASAATAFIPGVSGSTNLGTTLLHFGALYLRDDGVINFNNGDVTLTHSTNALTLGGGDLALGANNLTMTGSIGATGARVTKGWFTDIEATNPIAGDITGNAATLTGFDPDSTSIIGGRIAFYDGGNPMVPYIDPDSTEVAVSLDTYEANLGSSFFLELRSWGLDVVGLPVGAAQPMTTNKALADNTGYWQAFTLHVADTITGVQFIQRTQGGYTAADSNCFALYTVSGATYTRVAMSANNGDLWKGSSYSLQTVPFTSTYVAPAGNYMIFFSYNQSAETTAPNIYCWNGSVGVSQFLTGANAHRLSGTVSAEGGPPTTEVASDLTAADVIYGIWLY